MTGPLVFEAAPLDARARGLLVAWLSLWFLAVAGLLTWSVTGGGLLALGLAVGAGTLLPLVLLVRLAGFPSAFEVDGEVLRVRRHLLPDRTFAIRGPVATGAGPLAPTGAAAWLGTRYGCRSLAWKLDADQRERVYLAVTDVGRAVRVGSDDATVLATPEDPAGLVRAARRVARQSGAPGDPR